MQAKILLCLPSTIYLIIELLSESACVVRDSLTTRSHLSWTSTDNLHCSEKSVTRLLSVYTLIVLCFELYNWISDANIFWKHTFRRMQADMLRRPRVKLFHLNTETKFVTHSWPTMSSFMSGGIPPGLVDHHWFGWCNKVRLPCLDTSFRIFIFASLKLCNSMFVLSC